MSVFDWLRGEFAKFGLAPLPLHDADLPDEPSAAPRPLLRAVVDTSAQRPTGGTAGIRSVDGPAAPASPGAVGIHPSQWPMDWDGIRRDLNHLRSALTEALAWIDEIDPTPGGLAGS